MKTMNISKPLVALALGGAVLAASAQTHCAHVGDTSVCQGPDGASTMSRVGDITLVTRADGSSATLTRVGDVTLISDSRAGMSGSAQHVGDVMIVSIGAGTSVCITIGASTLCDD